MTWRLTFLALIGGPTVVGAQDTLAAGSFVRVSLAGQARRIEGTVQSLGGGILVIRRVGRDSTPRTIPVDSVVKAEVSTHTDWVVSSPVADGVILGGLGAGTYIGATQWSSRSTGGRILGGALGLLAASFVVGEFVEHVWPPHGEPGGWRRVRLGSAGVTVWPLGVRMDVALSR